MTNFAKIIDLFLLSAALCSSAFAHPLGNFSINQYFLVDMRTSPPDVYYLVDMAEIPSFTELDLLDTDFDSDVTEEETKAYLDRKTGPLLAKLSLRLEDAAVPLTLVDRKLSLLEGAGGMTVFNIVLKLRPEGWAPSPETGPVLFEIASTNYERESGVRECKIILDGLYTDDTFGLDENRLGYQTLVDLDPNKNPVYQDFDAQFLVRLTKGSGEAPVSEPTPIAFDWTATAKAAAGTGETTILEGMLAAAPLASPANGLEESAPEAEQTLTARYTEGSGVGEGRAGAMLRRVSDILRTKELSWPMYFGALAIALVLGMGHAFSPGHGKTVMAAYLIGERGTVKHAVILGTVVTITHVWSVIVLGLVTLYAGERFTEDQLSFWTGVASGLIIVAIGTMLFFRRYASFVLARQDGHRHGDSHDHHQEHGDHHHDRGHPDHDHHGHDHAHGHHGHSHVIVGKAGLPPTYGNILWLGISGGIVPCPAALVVLLLAIKFGRLAMGLWLIVVFSFGLAIVLVALGIAVVRASGEIRRRIGERSPLLLGLPVVSSVLITVLGAWVVVWTLLQHNVIVVMPG